MKQIHKNKPSKRILIGEPFERLIDELLKSTNGGNISPDWNYTDMTRYALAELWKRTNKPLPKECADMLKKYYADLDV